jgi:sigma-B regulation protein RsbU (phosphoserine phosphatase)
MTPSESITILAVDDLPENLTLIARVLQCEGYEVLQASSGMQALELAGRKLPDLAVVDVMMPEMDGIETCRALKKLAGESFLPVALITAREDAPIKRQGLDAGAEEFLSKPFDHEELVARIRALLRTKRLYDALGESNRKLEGEMQALASLQRSLLPVEPPRFEGVRLWDHYQPSRSAGGDFFDYVAIDERNLGVAVGDVSGHGPQAAVIMAMTKMSLHLNREAWESPAELLGRVNEQLRRFTPPEEFVTMFYGVLDTAGGMLHWASAGHCPPIRLSAASGRAEALEVAPSLPLGLVEDAESAQGVCRLERGDRLLVYTDGVVEASDDRGEMFGESRLIEAARRAGARRGERINPDLIGAVADFTGGREFRDDCTLLLLEWRGSRDSADPAASPSIPFKAVHAP